MYPLQNQVRALPAVFVSLGHSEAIVFDQKLFGAVPRKQRRDHQADPSHEPKSESTPANAVDQRFQAVILGHQAASARKRLRILSAADETFPAPSVMMRSPGHAAFVMDSTLSSILPR